MEFETVNEKEIKELLKSEKEPEIFVFAGRFYSYKGELEKAEDYLEKALNLFLKRWGKPSISDVSFLSFSYEETKFFQAVRELAIVKMKLGKFLESLVYMNKILEFDPDDRVIKRLKNRLESLTGVSF
ncbi:tetratricopeptide repeat protein [Desulfurobacterium atlanticum]|uniref:Tetratricopeptide repeat-containing protein n=1 Tax=Desulfurobacterium atlanticum TaxID=240169 RepID=A0A238YR87_9BACT|nr:hypothetical protein [Desulfurobacterium atlanticum]SNR72949.1 Tetratricopeptide repeat-containing protein [Desulfurobacterium atlanticum]